MSALEGVRVVRGPGWKYGDQDGGEGNAGTIIDSSTASEIKPAQVTVVWDSNGMKADYRSDSNGNFDLRIVNNMSRGIKHPNIICGADDCWVQEIRDIRWQCTTCHINLCTNCFLKKLPHNKDHFEFKRYDIGETTHKEPAIVMSWESPGPDSRTQLVGIYPGAKVFIGPKFPFGLENERKKGLVIPDPKEELYGGVLVEWLSSKERNRHQRIKNGKLNLFIIMEHAGIGGYYNLKALPILNIPIAKSVESSIFDLQPDFNFGDRVQIDSNLKVEDLRTCQIGHGGFESEMGKFIGQVGTVMKTFNESGDISVKFKNLNLIRNWRFNSVVMRKLNTLTVNQIIRIKNNENTIKEINDAFATQFSSVTGTEYEKLEGSIGYISSIDEKDANKLFIKFDKDQIYKWLDKSYPLPAGWMEPFKTGHPEQDDELAELNAKEEALFFKAVTKGNLRLANILVNRKGIDINTLNSDGNTALHVACKEGYIDHVKWLIDEAKANIEKVDSRGFRAIHFAAAKCQPQILKMLLERGAQINSQTDFGRTALHHAVRNYHTSCVRLLIQRGCDVNVQDGSGNTSLHYAIDGGNVLAIRLLSSCGRINWKLRNQKGFNVLHLAVIMDNHKIIRCILENEKEDLALEWILPTLQCNVFHYACTHRNYPVVELLINHLKHSDNLEPMMTGPSRVQKLLEARNEYGLTALLISSQKKDCATIELLIAVGSDTKSCDPDGNTAITLAASSSAQDELPSKENSPAIFQLYQEKDPPILSLIMYLMLKGCSWTTANKSGQKASDILFSKGYSKDVLDSIIEQFAINSSAERCTDKEGNDANNQPTLPLACCPQMAPAYRACCSKCGSASAVESSIPSSSSAAPSTIIIPDKSILDVPLIVKQEVITLSDSDDEEDNVSNRGQNKGPYQFNWFADATKNGHIKDQFENKYVWHGTRKSDGGIGFRCNVELNKIRCTAVARRFVNQKDGSSKIRLETPHRHGAVKREKYDHGSCRHPGMPLAKRRRNDGDGSRP